MSEPTTQSQSRPLCDDCQSGIAEIWCEQCGINYCSACSNTVHKQYTFGSHSTLPIDKTTSDLFLCKQHPKKKYEYWCIECETIICGECRTSEHKDHKCALVSEVSEDMEKEIKSSFIKIQSSLEQTVKKANEMINRWSQPSTAETTSKEKATQAFASLRVMIDECEKVLHQKLEMIENKNKEYIKEYPAQLEAQLETQRKQMRKRNEYFMRMLSSDKHQMQLKSKSNLKKNLDQMSEQIDRIEGPVKIHYYIEGLNKLQTTIANSLKQIPTIDQREKKLQFIEASPPKPLSCGGMTCSICGLCFDWYNDGGWKLRDTANCCGDIRCFFVSHRNRRRYIYHAVSIGADNDHSPAICACNRTSENVQ